ncbi:MAG TPA: hypothetical protein VF772_14820, partial [Terriglobales bacterium]
SKKSEERGATEPVVVQFGFVALAKLRQLGELCFFFLPIPTGIQGRETQGTSSYQDYFRGGTLSATL